MDEYVLSKWVPVAAAVLIGSIFFIIGWDSTIENNMIKSISLFVLSFCSVSLLLTYQKYHMYKIFSVQNIGNESILKNIYNIKNEINSSISLSKLINHPLVSFNGWSIESSLVEKILFIINEKKHSTRTNGLIVECGSGNSTIAIASWLKKIEWGTLVSLDHDEYYAKRTNMLLKSSELDNYALVIDAPLKSWSVNDFLVQWYNFEPSKYLNKKIDVLLIDGPPARIGPLIRYPAVHLLRNYIDERTIIILHDAYREDEKKAVSLWENELGFTAEMIPDGQGLWILKKINNTYI